MITRFDDTESVYLTFDDSPSTLTLNILNELCKTVGACHVFLHRMACPSIFRSCEENLVRGPPDQNHSMYHPNLWRVSPWRLRNEVGLASRRKRRPRPMSSCRGEVDARLNGAPPVLRRRILLMSNPQREIEQRAKAVFERCVALDDAAKPRASRRCAATNLKLLHVRLYDRPRNDMTRRFLLIAEALTGLRSRSCIIDEEAVACADNGLASFERMRYRQHDGGVFLCAFDLIELNGDEMRRDPYDHPTP